jgi:hypothetical protein
MKSHLAIVLAAALLTSSALAQSPPNTASMVPNGGGSQASLLTNASVQTGVLSPTGTASTTGVQMGLGLTGCTITPVLTGRVELAISGRVSNSAASVITAALRSGTGTIPSNGGPLAETQVGASAQATVAAAAAVLPMTLIGNVTGLTLGTPVWFDISLQVSAGTGTITVACTAHEF